MLMSSLIVFDEWANCKWMFQVEMPSPLNDEEIDTGLTTSTVYPCAFANSGSSWGPQNWWCGPMGTNICTNDTGSHFVQMAPSVGVKLLTSATSTSASATGKATGTTIGPNDSQLCSPVASSTNNGAIIALGVALGVTLIACAVLGVCLVRSYRKQKAQIPPVQAWPPKQEYYPPSFKADTNTLGVYPSEMTGLPPSTELDAARQQVWVELGTGNK